jgi:dihydroorotate dehydrogenase electron transfer subunit
VEFIFAATGPGTRWLAERRSRDVLDVTGPHGRPFPVPKEPAACLLVGGGYGSAPLFALAGKLKDRHCPVDFLLGAASGDRVFGALTARRMGRTATITTEDGSLGSRGLVTDLLAQVIQRERTEDLRLRAVRCCARSRSGPALGPSCWPPWRAMAWRRRGLADLRAAGVGSDGITRMVRAARDGPVFRSEQVRWDITADPVDAFGRRAGSRGPQRCWGAEAGRPVREAGLLARGRRGRRRRRKAGPWPLTCAPGW